MTATSDHDGATGPTDLFGVSMLPWGLDRWALSVPPGSDTRELFAAVARMPGALRFVEAFGDVEVVLVYKAEKPEASRRRAAGSVLKSALDVVPASGRRWMTNGERQAYLAGRADMADSLMREVTGGAIPVQVDEAAPGPSPG